MRPTQVGAPWRPRVTQIELQPVAPSKLVAAAAAGAEALEDWELDYLKTGESERPRFKVGCPPRGAPTRREPPSPC